MTENKTIRSNLHTHTKFSDGRSTLDENVKAAVEAGFLSLGISDHTYVEGVDFGIHADKTEDYVRSVRSAANEYKDKLDIFCGIELDAGIPCKRELLDYVIASVHFIDAKGETYPVDLSGDEQRRTINEAFGGKEHLYAAAYFDTLAEHVEHSKPDIVGHFDLLTKFNGFDETDERYRESALSTVRRIMKTCTRFEVNTGAMARGYKTTPYPARFILEEIKSLGGSVILSSDCHDADKLTFAFDESVKLLKEIGFTHVDRLTADGFVADEI